MRGGKPKPSAVHALTGTFRANCHRARLNEPQPPDDLNHEPPATDDDSTASAILITDFYGLKGRQNGNDLSTVTYGTGAPIQVATVFGAGTHLLTLDGAAGSPTTYGGPLDSSGTLGLGTRLNVADET